MAGEPPQILAPTGKLEGLSQPRCASRFACVGTGLEAGRLRPYPSVPNRMSLHESSPMGRFGRAKSANSDPEDGERWLPSLSELEEARWKSTTDFPRIDQIRQRAPWMQENWPVPKSHICDTFDSPAQRSLLMIQGSRAALPSFTASSTPDVMRPNLYMRNILSPDSGKLDRNCITRNRSQKLLWNMRHPSFRSENMPILHVRMSCPQKKWCATFATNTKKNYLNLFLVRMPKKRGCSYLAYANSDAKQLRNSMLQWEHGSLFYIAFLQQELPVSISIPYVTSYLLVTYLATQVVRFSLFRFSRLLQH
jgi:hypothetical protein